jgi:acetyl-CoA C-acetyltransferase
MNKDPIVIVSGVRTPIGALLGDFKDMSAPQLGSVAIRAAVERAGLPADAMEEAYMGCVLSAGIGQAPARQAALGAGLPEAVPCTTVSKVCGSGLKAVMLAHDGILSGASGIVVAGGMESMTNAPHLMLKVREGWRMGDRQVMDHMFFDGLEDAYEKGKLMGVFAEACAQHYQFTREAQDKFAIASLERAKKASSDGSFKHEIVPVIVKGKKGDVTVALDEMPHKADPAKIPTLKPAFAKDGTVTAANASSISDGAAALVLMREGEAEKRGIKPLARIVGHASHAQAPAWFATAPVGAFQKLAEKTGWDLKTVDLFEVNEAFAVVTMAAMHDLGLPHEKMNVHGGACAMGHPIGASGARILVTLLNALEKYGKKRGMAGLCIGGGEAVAMAVERVA